MLSVLNAVESRSGGPHIVVVWFADVCAWDSSASGVSCRPRTVLERGHLTSLSTTCTLHSHNLYCASDMLVFFFGCCGKLGLASHEGLCMCKSAMNIAAEAR